MQKIHYTHKFSLVLQIIILWPLSLAIGITLAALIASLDPSSTNVFIQLFSMVSFVIGVIGTIVVIGDSINSLATKLYLKYSCKTNISYSEAKDISFLFDGSLAGKWYPFTFLKDIPEELRTQVLFEFADKIKGKTNKKSTKHNYGFEPADKEEPDETVNSNYSEKYKNACIIIGVPFNHSNDLLKAVYRKQMMKYHPDLYVHEDVEIRNFANHQAVNIINAYNYLKGAANGSQI